MHIDVRTAPATGVLGQILVVVGAIAATQASLVALSPALGLITFAVGALMIRATARPQPE